jgi:hypothetical protein
MGARHPKVAQAMKSFGFSDEVLHEGWSRLEASAELTLVEEPSLGPNPKIIEQLDRFENVWFTVVRATLKSNYPEIHDALFAKLSQVSGRDSALTVGTFLRRLREMEAGGGVYTENGLKARELLAARGLTESVVVEAEAWIASIKTTVKMDDSEIASKAEQEKAVEHLWAWYLEWSAIARIAVKDRRLLRSMGFLSGSGKASLDEELFEEASTSSAVAAVETEAPGEVEVTSYGPGDAIAAE